jgi:hypothetical protein
METKNKRIALTPFAKEMGFDEDSINFLNDALERKAKLQAKESKRKAKQESSNKLKKKG